MENLHIKPDGNSINIKDKKESNEFENQLNELHYYIYIDKNYDYCLKLFEKLFSEFLLNLQISLKAGNKHKCNRNPECSCIELGLCLIDMVAISSSNVDVFKLFEKYFHNPGINLPFKVFKKLCLYTLRSQDFQKAKSIIENYMIYSKLEYINDNPKLTNYLPLKETEFEVLYEILIFNIILIQSGFYKANLKINALKDEKLKQKFLSKLILLLKLQTGKNIEDLEDFRNIIYDPEDGCNYRSGPDQNLCNKLTNAVESKISENSQIISIDKNFSGYTIKTSILYRILSLFTNKKMLIFIIAVYLIWIFNKILKYRKIDQKLLNTFLLFFEKIRNLPIISGVDSFVSGLFKLLINY
jgi:hypothetical protein